VEIEKKGSWSEAVEEIFSELNLLEEKSKGITYRETSMEEFEKDISNIKEEILELESDKQVRLALRDMLNDIEDRIQMKWTKQLIEIIEKKREEKGISKNKLADISGVSGAYVWRLANGERNNISLGKLKPLSDALGVKLWEVFMEVDGKNPNEILFATDKEKRFLEEVKMIKVDENLSHEQVNRLVNSFLIYMK
jgi:transcriptional regulator with XRE-family HTH domain